MNEEEIWKNNIQENVKNCLSDSQIDFNHQNNSTAIDIISREDKNVIIPVEENLNCSATLENINVTNEYFGINDKTSQILDDLLDTIVSDLNMEISFDPEIKDPLAVSETDKQPELNTSETDANVSTNSSSFKQTFHNTCKNKRRSPRREISQDDIEELKSMNITLTEDEIEPQHQLEEKITRPPSKQLKKEFLKYNVMKKGKYTPAEDKIINNNWNQFCKEHDWNKKKVHPFLQLKYKGCFLLNTQSRLKFIQYLAKGLSDRTLYSTYKRFKVLFANRKREKRFKKREDMKIWKYIRKTKDNPNKYKKLAKMMNRSEQSILKRYVILKRKKFKNKGLQKRVDWSLQLVEQFIKELMDATLCESVDELKDALIPKIVWLMLEKKMNIPYERLMNFWFMKLHLQLFSEKMISQNTLKIMLIEYLFRENITTRREINWSKLVKYCDGATVPYLCYLLVKLMKKVDGKSFSDIIKNLYNYQRSAIIDKDTDKNLPRIRYENGTVKIIDY